MKKSIFLSFMLFGLLSFAVTGVQAQVTAKAATANYDETAQNMRLEEDTKALLEKLFDYAKTKNYGAFGGKMIYSGRDPRRTLKFKMNLNDAHERLEVENTLNYVRHLLKKNVLHHAKQFRKIKGMENDIYFWQVEFTNEKGKTKTFNASFTTLGDELLFIRLEKV